MEKENAQKKTERPPVICIMGHIDHGKSTLLDYIRKTNIVDKEAGGITQKISAYEVVHKGKKITFLDTPGHESFAKIRERGASVADIAVLVVSAEDGVKKQTLEALHCIQESNTPMIVAINKIDKPGADIERTKSNLAENEIYLEGYGGTVPFVPISAKFGQGVDDLLDLMLLMAEVEELTGDINKPAEGVVIEANMDKQKGISATMIIQDGTIKSGMFVTCGKALAPTRIMENFLGKKVTEATFSSPIRIIGFDVLPKVGTRFATFTNKEEALDYISKYQEPAVIKCDLPEITLDENGQPLENTGVIDVVIKADVMGSIEGIEHELEKIKTDRMKVKIVHFGVGDITENDIHLLGGKPDSLVLGFNVKIDAKARASAEKSGIQVKTFDIIYKLTEWLQEMAVSKTPKVSVEEMSGRAKVLKFFSAVKDKNVIGARVEEGEIRVGDEIKLMRKEVEVGRVRIRELQQMKEKVSEVRTGVEFGCQLQCTITPAPGDKFEAYKIIQR
jgi:translation initiation factor IF-2